ncbi:hypothetical protein [Bacillus sp. JJ722]|uniref:hypothetical protein n=1 Tax=Bacillus sp. JJ722 TaxID=3122973 RepID=UPI00300043D9
MTGEPVLMMNIDGTLYPVAMTEKQYWLFKRTVTIIAPITVLKEHPIGKAVNLLDKK